MKIILTKEESEKIIDTLLFKEIKAKLLNIGIVPELSVEVSVEDFKKMTASKTLYGYPIGEKIVNTGITDCCPEMLSGHYVKVWFNFSNAFNIGFADDWDCHWNTIRSTHITHFMILENQKPSL